MNCNQCGTKLEEGAKLCEGCDGSGATVSQSGNTSLQLNNDAVKSKAVGAVLIVVLAALISVIAYNLFLTTKPISTVNKFISSINERDFNKFSACIDPGVRENFPTDEVMFNSTFNDTSLKMLKVTSEEKTAEKVKIAVEVELKMGESGENPQSIPLIFELRKTSKGWLITNLDS